METQKVSEDVVYVATLQTLSNDTTGEIERLLQDMLQWEREHPITEHIRRIRVVHGTRRRQDPKQPSHEANPRGEDEDKQILQLQATDTKAVERATGDYQGMATPPEETAEIPPDLFDIVIGHDDKKDIILRSIASDRPVPCLLHGSPASAKTLMLEELARLPGSKFVLGSNLSKAGLFEVLFNERPKYLILDELDKVDDERQP